MRHCVAMMTAGLVSMAHVADAAEWISTPAARTADAAKAPIALDFRRDVKLQNRPERFLVRVSADQRQNAILDATGPINKAADYMPVVVAFQNGAPVRLSDVATAVDSAFPPTIIRE